METSSPSIIYNISFSKPAGEDIGRDNFFRCKGGFDIVDYCDRKGAADKLPAEEAERVRAFIELSQKSEKNIVDYADERPGSTGIFTRKPNFDEKDKVKLKESLANTGSILWSSVVSFTPEFARQFCNNKAAAREIIENCLPQLFKNSKLDYENIEWFGAFHTNTDNPHIHLMFWEKEPLNINSKGEKSYCKKGVIPDKNLDNFKTGIAKYLNMSKLDYFPMRDEIKEEALLNFKNNKEMLNCFLRYGQSIIDEGNFQYKRLTPENQKLVKSFVEKTIAGNPELNTKYEDYKAHLLKTQTELIGLHLDVHFGSVKAKKIPDEINNFYGSRVDELDNRLCNGFLKILKDYAMERIKLDKAYDRENKQNAYLKSVKTNTVYGCAADDKCTKMKARATRELMTIANKLISSFILDSGDVVADCEKSTEQYKLECIERGEELIYDDITENN